jgi:uncharacterized protein YwqG
MKEEYEIIRLRPYGKKYMQLLSDEHYKGELEIFKGFFPNKTIEDLKNEDREMYDIYSELDIPIGKSRIGGPIVDLPDGINYPDNFIFLAQIDCSEYKKCDRLGLLPDKGFIYFFTRDPGNVGCVFYTPKSKDALKRIIKEHLDWYYNGQLLDEPKNEIEKIDNRYKENNGKREWDYNKGSEISKIYGIYSNIYKNEKETIDFMNDDNIVILLQIAGELQNEGCQTVYMNKEDLKRLDFSKCIFEYSE